MAIVYARVNPSSQQSEHIRIGVVFTAAWQSVDVDAATRIAIFADPFLQASDTDPGGSSGITINEDNPTKVRTYSALIKRPAAAEFGVGVCQIGGKLSISNGVSWLDLNYKNTKIRPTLLVFGNSIAGQDSKSLAAGLTTNTIASIHRAGVYAIQLVVGGVAAAGFTVGDYAAVQLCNQQLWYQKITGIAGEVVSFDKPLPVALRIGTAVGKVTLPTLWGSNQRSPMGFITIANALAGGPLHILHGYGFGGGRLSDFIADLPKYLTYYNPNFVYFIALENDIAAGASAESLIRLINFAAKLCLNMGTTPCFEQCLPSTSINNAGLAAVFDTVNAYLNSLSTTIPGSASINHGNLYLDTSAINSRPPLAGWTDGVHPNKERRLEIGRYKLADFKKIFGSRTESASFLLGINTKLSGTGGTFTASGGGTNVGPVPANTTITSTSVLITSVTAKDANDSLVVDVTIPNDSNIGNTQWGISQTHPIPGNASPDTYAKAVMRIAATSIMHISMMQLSITAGGITTSTPLDGDLTKVSFLTNEVFVLETLAIPLRDPTATNIVISFNARPETLVGAANVEFKCTILEFGYVLSGAEEVIWNGVI